MNIRSSKLFCIGFFVCLSLMMVATAHAQRGGGRGGAGGGLGGTFGGRGGGGFGGRGGGDTIGFVLREDVQKELGLSSGAVENLTSLVEEAQQKSRDVRQEMMASFREVSGDERAEVMADAQKETAAISKKTRKDVMAKLSSSQSKRYAELELQYQVQQGNLTGAVAAADIELSSADKEKLEEAVSSVREKLRQKTAELTRQLYAEALADIADADIENLMGKSFTFESTRGGGRGQGQGRGGNTGRTGRQRGGVIADDDGGDARRARRGGGDAGGDTQSGSRRQRPN